jgi:hypothetical protein
LKKPKKEIDRINNNPLSYQIKYIQDSGSILISFLLDIDLFVFEFHHCSISRHVPISKKIDP